MNKLYYGDCLEILQHSLEDESIDLIYIDPPFNSKRDHNVLFESVDMTDTKAQKQAFADTWSNVVYFDELNRIMDLDLDLYRFLKALDDIRISRGVVSYLTIMAHRIYYMHKKLKDTGSFYLHCDPNMSHYLKIIMDLIFGRKNFQNEIVWYYRRWTAPSRSFQRMHDIILLYSKTKKSKFNRIEIDPTIGQKKKHDKGWDRNSVIINGRRQPQLIIYNKKKVEDAIREGRIKVEEFARIIEVPIPKTTASDVWIINYLNSQAKERLGYPTQKPEELLERIIHASSNKKDVVADFFCGCGTTIAVAQKLGRKWIGVDISHLAVRLVYDRLLKPFEGKPEALKKISDNIEINGFPKDIASAKDLAEKTDKSRIKFQDWIVEIMMNGVSNPKKTADGGYDGYITFNKSEKEKDVVLIEVKSGKCGVGKLRSFITTVKQEKASFGAFVCFQEHVTPQMERFAKQQGYYKPDIWGKKYERIQIVTVEDLFAGKSIRYPLYQNITFKTATNIPMSNEENQNSLFE